MAGFFISLKDKNKTRRSAEFRVPGAKCRMGVESQGVRESESQGVRESGTVGLDFEIRYQISHLRSASVGQADSRNQNCF